MHSLPLLSKALIARCQARLQIVRRTQAKAKELTFDVGYDSVLWIATLSFSFILMLAKPSLCLGILGFVAGGAVGYLSVRFHGLKRAKRSGCNSKSGFSQEDSELAHLRQNLKDYSHEVSVLSHRLKTHEGEMKAQIRRYADVVAERNHFIQKLGPEAEKSKIAIAKSEAECLRLESLVQQLCSGTRETQKRAFRVAKREISEVVLAAILHREQQVSKIRLATSSASPDRLFLAQAVISKLNINVERLASRYAVAISQVKAQ